MNYTTPSEYFNDNCIYRNNKIYSLVFELVNGEIYLKEFEIHPEHRGRHRNYTKRILTNLCKEFHTSMFFEAYIDLVPFYEKIGAFHILGNDYWMKESYVEMYFDPLGINYN